MLLTHWEGEPAATWAERWHAPAVEIHDEVGSTNDRLRAVAEKGARAFTVVLAEGQTSGRGRHGASWHSPQGAGVWMSVLLPSPDAAAAHLSLLVGLAAARAADETCPGLHAQIEWPNDVLVQGRKVGGVLCERVPGAVIAGIGINVRQRPEDFPEELATRAISLETAVGAPVSRVEIASALLRHLRELCGDPGRVLTASAVAELAERDSLRDRAVRSQMSGPGVARGILPDGSLELERSDGSRVQVVAGSVSPAS